VSVWKLGALFRFSPYRKSAGSDASPLRRVSRTSKSALWFEMEPVALNNHPRSVWPKDQRRDLQSRHRQLAATRSLSRPIITGTYSTKCSPPLKRTSKSRSPPLAVVWMTKVRQLAPLLPSHLSLSLSLGLVLCLAVICPDDHRR